MTNPLYHLLSQFEFPESSLLLQPKHKKRQKDKKRYYIFPIQGEFPPPIPGVAFAEQHISVYEDRGLDAELFHYTLTFTYNQQPHTVHVHFTDVYTIASFDTSIRLESDTKKAITEHATILAMQARETIIPWQENTVAECRNKYAENEAALVQLSKRSLGQKPLSDEHKARVTELGQQCIASLTTMHEITGEIKYTAMSKQIKRSVDYLLAEPQLQTTVLPANTQPATEPSEQEPAVTVPEPATVGVDYAGEIKQIEQINALQRTAADFQRLRKLLYQAIEHGTKLDNITVYFNKLDKLLPSIQVVLAIHLKQKKYDLAADILAEFSKDLPFEFIQKQLAEIVKSDDEQAFKLLHDYTRFDPETILVPCTTPYPICTSVLACLCLQKPAILRYLLACGVRQNELFVYALCAYSSAECVEAVLAHGNQLQTPIGLDGQVSALRALVEKKLTGRTRVSLLNRIAITRGMMTQVQVKLYPIIIASMFKRFDIATRMISSLESPVRERILKNTQKKITIAATLAMLSIISTLELSSDPLFGKMYEIMQIEVNEEFEGQQNLLSNDVFDKSTATIDDCLQMLLDIAGLYSLLLEAQAQPSDQEITLFKLSVACYLGYLANNQNSRSQWPVEVVEPYLAIDCTPQARQAGELLEILNLKIQQSMYTIAPPSMAVLMSHLGLHTTEDVTRFVQQTDSNQPREPGSSLQQGHQY